MFDLRYTPYTDEAPAGINGAMPLTTPARGVAVVAKDQPTPKEWIVYRATCSVTKKSYIGITNKDEAVRWWFHLRDARTKRRDGAFHQAIRKYGAEAFVREVLYTAVDEREAIACERGLIAQYGTLFPSGYNLSVGGETYKGGNIKGKRISEEHKEHLRRLAAAMKGKKRKPESIEKGRASLMGHFVSEETRRKIGAKSKGRIPSAEARIKMGNALRGKNHTQSTRKKMSVSMRAAWADPERKAERLAKTAIAQAKSGYDRSAALKAHWAKKRESKGNSDGK
jgi:group I intron endonuclease